MKAYTCVASCLLLLTATALVADDKPTDQAKLFKEYMEKFGPPGPEHKFLDPLVGNWQAQVKMWMDPAQPPHQSEGTLQRKALFEGRFVEENYSGKMMDRPFQGRGVMGFDRAKKKFVNCWFDSMSTGIYLSHGTYDENAKTWTFKHEDDCPITGERVRMRDVLRIESADKQVMEMYRQLGSEKETKVMEITLTRVK